MDNIEIEQTSYDEKSLRELLRDLSSDSTTLFRQESELFRREMEQRISRLEREVGILGGGGVIAFIGVLALTAALILLLDLAMAGWLAALLVGIAYVAVGGIMLANGRKRLKEEELAPKESIRSLKQDMRTVREAMR